MFAAAPAASPANHQAFFKPLTLPGGLSLKNRLGMPAMTRNRGNVPGPLAVQFYKQRAGLGLIVSEGTFIEPLFGSEWINAPGIYSQEQIEGWKKVTDAVHAAGGIIFCQLWHVGRLTHPLTTPGGADPVGPSPIKAKGGKIPTPEGVKNYVQPRALTLAEVKEKVALYAQATKNARAAGFDGVELHSAFGYLPDQFLHSGSNQRDDEYGGSIENRCRFALEAIDAMAGAWAPGRVGIKVSPTNTYNDMSDPESRELYTHLFTKLNDAGISYLTFMEPSASDVKHGATPLHSKEFRDVWKGVLFSNCGLTLDGGAASIESGAIDGALYGLLNLANPDLAERVRTGQLGNLNAPNFRYLYTPGPEGYTDYPNVDGSITA